MGELDEIVRCVGGGVVSHVCGLLARDFDVWGHGLPDLVLWNSVAATALLVEVKGPGDSLSHAQTAWIHQLIEAGAAVELCHVQRPR